MHESQVHVGDSAGEHLYMKRGNYSAWAYVIASALVVGLVLLAIFSSALDRIGLHDETGLVAGGAAAVGLVALVYWDRWRVIECFSSRFCTGWANLSIIIVTPIAAGYALTRFAMRVVRQEHRLGSSPTPSAWS